jgi:uncharacterized protein YkwD
MERHNVSIFTLVAVVAMAFPVLYSTHAKEFSSPQVVYQVSALSIKTEVLEKRVAQTHLTQRPWDIHSEYEDTVTEPKIVYVEESLKPEKAQMEVPVVEQVLTVAERVVVPDELPDELDVEFKKTILLEIQRLTDRVRTHDGLHLFKHSSAITDIALEHSEDMIDETYFAHTSPDGCTLTCRFENADYTASTWGENIASMEGDNVPTAKEVATSFFEQWMDSKGHRKNILSAEYTHQGIGIAREGETLFVTVNFAKPLY